jgi:hypothetical protein
MQASSERQQSLRAFCRYMEYALIFGLAIPLVLPMLAIVLAVQCAVFHFAKKYLVLRIIHDHRPPLNYLWFSVFLGYLLMACFFVDNDMHGAGLAVGGPPSLVLAMLWYDRAKIPVEIAQPPAADDNAPLASGATGNIAA